MEEQIREALRKILDVADLSVVTERALRKQLAESHDADMTPWHDLIKTEVAMFLEEQEAPALPEVTPSEKRKSTQAHEQQPPAKARAIKVDGSVEVELSDRRKVTVGEFKGKQRVDIREYYEKDGELKPGAKGLSLSAEQWALISSARAAITKALVDKKLDYELDLGGMRKVSVSQFKGKTNINMREYYEKDGELKPGKKGIALTEEQWETLAAAADRIDAATQSNKPVKSQPVAADHAAGPSTCEGDGSELDAEDEGFVDLGKGKRASVSDFKGKKFLNIREYYSKDGQWLPGKKGIALTAEQGAKLAAAAEQLSRALSAKEELEVPLANMRHAKVSSYKGTYTIDVREYYEKGGKQAPGRKGLALSADQWEKLVPKMSDLLAALG